MAKRLAIPSKELELTVVGPRHSYNAARVQSITLNTDVPNTNIDEHGNPNHAGTVSDIATVSLTFEAMDVSTKLFSALTGTDPASFPASGVDIDQLDEIDAVLYVKDESSADYVKSASARKLQVSEFTYSYNVTGDATENYTATGSKMRWFKNDVIVDRFTTGTTSFSLSETPIQLRNSDYLISVILDGDYLTEVAAGPSTGEYSVSGTTLTTGDSRTTQVIAVYHANPAGNNWTNISDDTIPASIRGRYTKIKIDANEIPRVQSVTINGTLNVQAVNEMGNSAVVGYQKQVPDVNGTITVLDTDTELIALLTTGELVPSGITEFYIEESCTASGIPLIVELYDPCDDTTVLKSVKIPELKVTGDSYTSNVNENAQVTFNWVSNTSECIIYSGAVP
jgi:hypothetical protein